MDFPNSAKTNPMQNILDKQKQKSCSSLDEVLQSIFMEVISELQDLHIIFHTFL